MLSSIFIASERSLKFTILLFWLTYSTLCGMQVAQRVHNDVYKIAYFVAYKYNRKKKISKAALVCANCSH